MARMVWMNRYGRSIAADEFLRKMEIRTDIEPHANATYKYCRQVIKNPTERHIGLFHGNRVQSSVLYVVEIIVQMHDRSLVRMDAVKKECTLYEVAVQIFLWDFMTRHNFVEPQGWFAMPLPFQASAASRLRTGIELHNSCQKEPLDREAFRSYYSFLDMEDDFFYDLVSHTDLKSLQFHLLSDECTSFATCLLERGWTNITYNIMISNEECMANKSKEWMRQNIRSVIPHVGRAIAFLYCAGIDHNDLVVRNIVVTTPIDFRSALFRVGIVDFQRAEVSHEVGDARKRKISNLTHANLSRFASRILSVCNMTERESGDVKLLVESFISTSIEETMDLYYREDDRSPYPLLSALARRPVTLPATFLS